MALMQAMNRVKCVLQKGLVCYQGGDAYEGRLHGLQLCFESNQSHAQTAQTDTSLHACCRLPGHALQTWR